MNKKLVVTFVGLVFLLMPLVSAASTFEMAKESKINFDEFIEINKKKLFNSKRNSDFVEALMEFGALVCKPKDPICANCNLNNNCKYFNSSRKIKTTKYKMTENKNYDVFCLSLIHI